MTSTVLCDLALAIGTSFCSLNRSNLFPTLESLSCVLPCLECSVPRNSYGFIFHHLGLSSNVLVSVAFLYHSVYRPFHITLTKQVLWGFFPQSFSISKITLFHLFTFVPYISPSIESIYHKNKNLNHPVGHSISQHPE